MSRTVFIDSTLTPLTQSLTATGLKSTAASGESYLDILRSLQAKSAAKTEEPAATDTAAMTMEEYQSYIGEKLQNRTRHQTRAQSSTAVIISDNGWERMKSDAAYENWVVSTVAADLASADPWSTLGSGSYTIHRFFDSEEAYSVDNWGKDYPGDIKSYLLSEIFDFDITGNRSSSGNFWFKLARKRLQAQMQNSLLQYASGISQLQGLKTYTAIQQMMMLEGTTDF